MLRTHSVRWPASFLTSARNFPSPDKATFSSVPVFVIWLRDIEANGTTRGHRRQAANPAAASSTSPIIAISGARDFFAGCGAIPVAETTSAGACWVDPEPEDRESEAPVTVPLPLGGAAGGGTLPLPAPLGLGPAPAALAWEPTPAPAAMPDDLPKDPPLLLRCNRFRSARSSAADWRRSSRSFSSVLLSVSSSSTGSYGLREIGAVGA